MRSMMLPTTAKNHKAKTSTKTSATSTPPSTTTPTTSTKVQFAYPTPSTADAKFAQMLPWDTTNGYPAMAQVVVDPDGNGDYTSLQDAFNDFGRLRAVPMAIKNQTIVDPTCRIDIMVTHGCAQSTLWTDSVPSFACVFAQNPYASTRPNVLFGLSGASMFWWGIDITNTGDGFAPKYPIHAEPGSGELNTAKVGGGGTMIFARCTLNNIRANAGGGTTPIGMDGSQKGVLLMYDMDMVSGSYTNLHGWDVSDTWPANGGDMTVIFDTVRYPNGSAVYGTNDTTDADLWVVNSTVAGVMLTGAASRMHTANNTITGVTTSYKGHGTSKTGATVTGVDDNNPNYPIPKGGISTYDRIKYGLKAMV